MHNIVIFGSQLENLRQAAQILESSLHMNIIATSNEERVRQEVIRNAVHLSIVDTLSITDEVQQVQKLRGMGYESSLLLLTDQHLTDLQIADRSKSKLHYLTRPYRDKELVGVVKKLLKTSRVPQQKHKRYETLQDVLVERFNGSETVTSKMFNLSAGGAYCEFPREKALIVGDLVRVTIQLDDLHKNHRMNAKVVWTTRAGRYSGQAGAGLKFIKSEDVYLHLMSRV